MLFDKYIDGIDKVVPVGHGFQALVKVYQLERTGIEYVGSIPLQIIVVKDFIKNALDILQLNAHVVAYPLDVIFHFHAHRPINILTVQISENHTEKKGKQDSEYSQKRHKPLKSCHAVL